MMKHECKITVIDKKCFADFQEQYLADPKWMAKQNFHNSAEEAYTG